jgi:rhodanese-related sulfurtransferase
MASLTPLSPTEVSARIRSGKAVLVDIREAGEVARERIAGSVVASLSVFEAAHLEIRPGREVVFMCRTGNRTGSNCVRLADRVPGEAFVLDGGLDAWKAQGLPTLTPIQAPLEMGRQVQITAGGLILLGGALGLLVHPGFWGLSALVGGGLFMGGVTGRCGMARLLAVMPWNRALRPA